MLLDMVEIQRNQTSLVQKKPLLDLAAKQGPNGGWEFAMLSFPCWHLAPRFGAASFPTLFSTASGVFGLVAGPSSVQFCCATEF